MTALFDLPVFNFINHTLSCRPLNLLMPVVSRLGGGELYFLLGILLLFSGKREIKMLGITLLAGLTISYYVTAVLKILIARPRPFIAFTNVILLGPMEKSYSFPSNHAVTAFMAASLLISRFRMRALFYSLAVLAGLSRIYIGVHYPSDIIGGAIIGLIIGLFLVKIQPPEAIS